MCESEYAFSTQDLKERAARIKAIIVGLEENYILALTSSSKESYMLDDGQTRIQTSFRNPNDIKKAIDGFEAILTRIQEDECGRITSLRDAKAWNTIWPYGGDVQN